ncbi:hypothetical protein BD289DRAFT_431952 [Coniella lustricola]|uniref:Uncharacterized protein n=1 Tax=Coniella lustricola TaxID=2025994 RepID=A0A2T3AAC7_9PEZI|nr:hypothetical protein BD289DRAFT_431952 [Coniella lustricola]
MSSWTNEWMDREGRVKMGCLGFFFGALCVWYSVVQSVCMCVCVLRCVLRCLVCSVGGVVWVVRGSPWLYRLVVCGFHLQCGELGGCLTYQSVVWRGGDFVKVLLEVSLKKHGITEHGANAVMSIQRGVAWRRGGHHEAWKNKSWLAC